MKRLFITTLMGLFLMGSVSAVWGQSVTDSQNSDAEKRTPVKTLAQAEREKKEEAEKTSASETSPLTKVSGTPTTTSLTNETVDMNGNTVSTIESYRDKALRRRQIQALSSSGQVVERMTEIYAKVGEIQSIEQTRFDEKGGKVFEGRYQFAGDNIAKAQITRWNPGKTKTSLTFDDLGFPLQEKIIYPDGSVKDFDATQSETGAKKLFAQELPSLDSAEIRPGLSRFLKAEDLKDGTFYPGGFIGLHFMTFQVGENGPTLSYIGGVDPLTGNPIVLATRTTTDYMVNFYDKASALGLESEGKK